MNGRLSFRTEMFPARERFAAFCEEMVRRYAALDILPPDPREDFEASMDLQRVGGIMIGRIASSATQFVRSPELVRDGDDALCTMLAIRGGAFQTQRGDGQMLSAGDGIICDNAHPGAAQIPAGFEFWLLKCPRPRLAALLPQTKNLAGLKLDADATARRLLFGYLRSTLELDLSGGGHAIALYDQYIVDLIALALGADGEARAVAEERSARTIRRAAILRNIETFMTDPSLSAEMIAARQGITTRYLRMLLEATGKSFSEHVMEMRLERAAILLREAAQCQRKISEIAFACGFGDLSYFNRAFRRRYGVTPSDMRAATQDAGR